MPDRGERRHRPIAPDDDGSAWRNRRLGVVAALFVTATTALVLVLTQNGANDPSARPSQTATTEGPAGSVIENATGTAAAPNQTGCSSVPSSCGYPDAMNTGVPSGTALTVVNGDVVVTTPGAVVDGKDIRGCVLVKAANVTIRRSKVTCTGAYGISSFPDEYTGGGLLIEDVEVDCANNQTTAIGYYGLTARRLNVHSCENGFDIDYGVTVVDSYIHDMYEGTSGHSDGIQLAGGADIVIRHNTIFIPGGTSAIISHPTDNANVTIEANLLGGGAYSLYCPSEHSLNFRVIDNRFSTRFAAKGGGYGPWDECQKVAELRGNVWDDTLEPVTD